MPQANLKDGELTPEQLQEVEQLAELLASLDDIAVIMQLDFDELQIRYRDKSTQFAQAYERGFRKVKLRIRASEIQQAERGSSPSQSIVEKHIEQTERTNNRGAT